MFTPRKINALEPKIREFCAQSLDPLVGTERFDFITDFGAQMPMKVISSLLGIPEDDQEMIRDYGNAQLRTEAGKPMSAAENGMVSGEVFEAYIDWRADHPSDDIMTELLNVEFTDQTGTVRRLRREELLVYLNVVAGAGNETTTRLIGWAAKVLAGNPDQRRELGENPALIPQAVEELLRFEPPAPHVARYVTRDVECYDVFDIHREQRQHLGFSVGTHYCLGSALARLEGRIALEEILKRFPEWDVDMANASSRRHPLSVAGTRCQPYFREFPPANDELR